MKHIVSIRADAQLDIIEAFQYIEEHSDYVTARRWHLGLENAIRSLAEFPQRCPRAREQDLVQPSGLRQLLYQSHRVLFVVQDDEVHVLHVRHTAQDEIAE